MDISGWTVNQIDFGQNLRSIAYGFHTLVLTYAYPVEVS